MKTFKPLVLAAVLAASTTLAVAASPATTASPDLVTSQFLRALNSGTGPAIDTLTPAQARQVLIGAQNSVKVDLSRIDVSNRTVEQDGITVPITIVRPQGATGTLPVFMFFHGGGWILGDFQTHERLVRDLVVQSGAVAGVRQLHAVARSALPGGDQPGVSGHQMGRCTWQ
jgi:acetyl esterase/lipase